MLDAAARGDRGVVVRLARRARGETQAQTAFACGFTQSDLSRLERGRRHVNDLRFLQKLASHLEIPPTLLGLADHPVGPPESDVNRREFITGAAATVAGVAFGAPVVRFLDQDRFEDLRTLTATYRRLDGGLASHDLIRPVVAHLEMAHSLLMGANDPRTQRLLAESVSETASLAAWLAWDRYDHPAADVRYRRAVELADAAGHNLLTAYQLGSLASYLIERRDRNAFPVLALARHKLGPCPPAVADSWLSCLNALASATTGDEHGAWTALERAESAHGKVGEEPPVWPWVAPFDDRKLTAQRVVCAARLNQPKRVLHLLPQLTDTQLSHRRQQALFAFDLAEVHIQAGDPETGAHVATNALAEVALYRSGRVRQRAASLRQRHVKRLSSNQLKAFDEHLRRAS
jgi:transcriptional regulator with XRE-family HTH domain